jgi:pimeloyl-ACP methyl ester carboxylesterase
MGQEGQSRFTASLALVATLTALQGGAATRITGDLARRAELGFGTRTTDAGLAVRDVASGSRAGAAGLRAGDRLLAVQGRTFDKAHVGRDLLRRLKGEQRATLRLEREGRRLDVSFTPATLPLEDLAGVDTTYGVVDTPEGARLRSVVTRPVGAAPRLPAIFLTQWVSCDGVEPLGTDAFEQVLRGLLTRSGTAVIRVDRSSGGDSEGPGCHELDYDTELAQYAYAFDRLTRSEEIDPARVVVFGMSLGSTTAPLLARGRRIAGVVVSGGGGLTYLERMLAFDRLGFERGGTPPGKVDAFVRESAAFHSEYLLRGRAPDAIAAERPELAGVWARTRGTGDGLHYGRPYAWHQQLAHKDLAAAWASLDVPVLVVYGEYDQFEPPHAHRAIADAVNRARPGRARAVEVPRMNHFYRVFATPRDAAADEPGYDAPELAVRPILDWLAETVGSPPAR